MADEKAKTWYGEIDETITDTIKENHKRDITAGKLQGVLLDIVGLLKGKWLFGGVVQPSSQVDITGDVPVFYLAFTSGTYTNFGNNSVAEGEFALFMPNLSGNWDVHKWGIGTLLDGKVDKVEGKVLSENDYTDEDKNKVDSLPDNVAGKSGSTFPEGNFTSFDASGNLQNSGCNEGTFIKGVQKNGDDLTPDAEGKVNVTVQDGITPHIDQSSKHWMLGDYDTNVYAEGKSALQIYNDLHSEDTPLTEAEFINMLKATYPMKYVGYDSNADSANVGAELNTLYGNTAGSTYEHGLYLMPNADPEGSTPPTGSVLFICVNKGEDTYKWVKMGDFNIPNNVVTDDRIDDTNLENPPINSLAKASDVANLKRYVGGGFDELKINVGSGDETGRYVKAADGTLAGNSNSTAHVSIPISAGYDWIRFLGFEVSTAYESGTAAMNSGFCFYNSNGDPITPSTQNRFDRFSSEVTGCHEKEYIISIPEGAVSFKTTTKVNTSNNIINDFYCYLQRGNTVEEKIEGLDSRVENLEDIIPDDFSIDDTELENPSVGSVPLATDVAPLKNVLQGISYQKTYVPIIQSNEGQNVFSGFINGDTGGVSNTSSVKYKHVEIELPEDYDAIVFSGVKHNFPKGTTSGSNNANTRLMGFAFYEVTEVEGVSQENPIYYQRFENDKSLEAETCELIEYTFDKSILRNASIVKISCAFPCKTGFDDILTPDNFYFYYQKGTTVKQDIDGLKEYVDKSIENFNSGVLPAYYSVNGYMPNLVDTINESIRGNLGLWKNTGMDNPYGIGVNKDSFIFFTDPHYKANYMMGGKVAAYLLQHTGLGGFICGGDIDGASAPAFGATTEDAITKILALFEEDMSHVLATGKSFNLVRGNHDFSITNLSNGNTSVDNYNAYMTSSQVFSYIMSKNKSVHYGVDTGNACCFYIDKEYAKLRYVFIDTNDDNRAVSYSDNSMRQGITDAQMKWVAETVLSTPSDYNIVIVSHCYTFRSLNSRSTIDSSGLFAGYSRKIAQLYTAISNGGTCTFNGEDFDFSDFEPKILAHICGHAHNDQMCYYKGVWQTTTAAAWYTGSNNESTNIYSKFGIQIPPMQKGSVKETSFDAVVVDTGHIDMIKVGDNGYRRLLHEEELQLSSAINIADKLKYIDPEFTDEEGNINVIEYYCFDSLDLNQDGNGYNSTHELATINYNTGALTKVSGAGSGYVTVIVCSKMQQMFECFGVKVN